MEDTKVRRFIELAGRQTSETLTTGTPETRILGAQLLLSEVLEYIIKGLGVIPTYNGVEIVNSEALSYASVKDPQKVEMIDGLADVAYTMYWNSATFGVPVEEAFELVCDNNLEKYVLLENWQQGEGTLTEDAWHLGRDITWGKEVVSVSVVLVDGSFYGVGKDKLGKVRKPSTYKSVDLSALAA